MPSERDYGIPFFLETIHEAHLMDDDFNSVLAFEHRIGGTQLVLKNLLILM